MNHFIVNGRSYSTPDEWASYDYIVTLALGTKKRRDVVYTVTYSTSHKGDEQRAGTLVPGVNRVGLEDDMVFDVADTSGA